MSAKLRTGLYAGLFSAASALWSVAGWAADQSPPADPAHGGPPSFISLPHHAGLTQPLVKGWHTFPLKPMPNWHALPIEEKAGGGGKPGGGGGGGGGYSLQPTNFLSLAPESALLSEINTSSSATSLGYTYKGETAITFASSTGLLVGGYNELPSVCGGFVECAPGATVASISTLPLLTWATSVLPLNIGTCFFFCNFLGYDPSLAVSSDHKTILYSYGVCGADGACLSGSLMIAKSTDGTNWTNHEVTSSINNALLTGFVDDKPYLAADPVNPGRAYVAWDRNAMVVNPRTRRITQTQIVYLAQTNDGGVDWSNPPNQYTNTVSPNAVSNPNNLQGRVIDAMPAVSNDGNTVYVVWIDYSQTPTQLFLNTCAPDLINLTNPIPTCDYTKAHSILSLNTPIQTDIGCNGGRAITQDPSIAVAPSGRLYVTFADVPTGASTYNIFLIYSDDGGISWSGPYRLNDDAAGPSRQHYFPALSVVGSTVYVSWLDRRNDSSDCLTQTFSTYTDGSLAGTALNVAPNLNVSAASSNQSSTSNQSNYNGNPNGPGDYSGNVGMPLGSNNLQFPLWPLHPTAQSTIFDIFTEEVARP